ncbi:DUF2935 domain-containing protein [Oceanirhabdus sp. W0125-5]|uniref:DUF2935 domain-containing protein n=1 Tax=Oceanirhabdus sp. W0125-5 TaxID=2999116 RepID=UPI0022F33D63|nr:DUF2935 domain-containing protein [Oceanirhabdus sp. W0125-5]WBW96534.1 DUF2935 domain-containing protein [Oceanirhabdus sp. W0125-5]
MDKYSYGYSEYDDYYDSYYDDYCEYDMKYDNCYCQGGGSRKDLLCVQVPNKKKNIREEILFWSCDSIEHIETILESNRVFELMIPSEIKRELVDISEELNKIVEKLKCKDGYDYYIYDELRYFLWLNAKLIKVFNRLMYEGYAGSAILFETLNHFMIEQIYITRIFELIQTTPNYVDKRNVWGPQFYTKFGLGNSQLECAYVQMYFWNVISAQHSSLLENTSPEFLRELSLKTLDRFQEFKKEFNDLNIELGENFHRLNKSKWDCNILTRIAKEAFELNKRFVKFLWSLSEESIGCRLPECTPQAFFDTREHILYEQRYYNDILEKILAVL